MINKSVYKLYEKLCQSKHIRYLISHFYRLYSFRGYQAVVEFLEGNKGRRLIAINASEIYQFNHIQQLYTALSGNPVFAVILIGSNPKKIVLPEYQKFMKANKLVLNKNIFSYIWLGMLNPEIFIDLAITPYHRLCPKKTIKILFAHGLSSLGFSKNHAHVKGTVTYDYILSTGPYQIKTLEIAAAQYKVKLPKIIQGGFIRGDVLAQRAGVYDKRIFKVKHGLADKATVLFAPTWGEFSATAQWIDPIAELSNELDFNLLVKLHPLMLQGKTKWETAGIDWQDKLDKLRNNGNLYVCDVFDLEECMLASDIMITDVSSVGIEYMFLAKPVIFLPAPQFFKIFGKDKPIFWVRDGLEVQDVVELKEKLERIISGSKCTLNYDISNISFNPGMVIESIIILINNLDEV